LTALRTELEETRSEFEKTNVKIEKLLMIEQEFNNASKLNDTLRSDLTILQEQYEAIQYERDDLEEQTKEVYRALNEEREAKNILENRLHEGIVRSPEQMHWLAESIQNLDTDSRLVSSPSPIPQFPNLLNELQQSIEAQTIDDSMQEANERMKLVEDANSLLTVEKKELEEKLKTVHEDIERVKMKHQEMIESKESDITSLKNEMGAKKEIIGQLKNKLNSLNGEKITLEIELEGIRDELNRTRDVSKVDIEKLMKEIGEEQNKSVELQGRVSELEEKLNQSMSSVEKLEGILFNSTNEVVSMKEEIYNLHKAVVSLHTENKFTPSDDAKVKTVSALPSNEESPNDYFLFVQEGKKKLRINKETQTISEVTLIREALRQVRIPLEKFTKMMLEHSLNTSSQHMPTANGISSTKTDDKKSLEMEATLSKMRARLANRNEEVNQLKTIMKARQTTVDVTVSSLKSKLEAQSRAHESDINQMKNKMKNIRKERDDQTSLCVLTSKRCQEYLDEIKKLKKKIEELKAETDQMKSETKLVNVYLQRAIKQKLDISQQLERYKEEEERTKVIPLTISASRV
jgi:chromosome segregation ATPase